MLQYIPKTARFGDDSQSVQDKLKYQTEHYVILVKTESRSGNQKAVKITFNSPETNFQVVDITLTPRQEQSSGGSKARVSVNGQEVQVDENQTHQQRHISIYSALNGEVVAEIKDQFYVVYDGERVRLNILSSKFRDAARGICGQFNDERIEDFLTPGNCLVQDHNKLIKSYEVEGSQGQQVREDLQSSNDMECISKSSPLYVDVVTASNSHSWQEKVSGQCTVFQTQYVQQNGEVCFTIRPMPACAEGCQPSGTTERNVPVHCVQKSSVAKLWKKQIDDGGSPDFSQKSESKTVSIQMPQSCV